MRCKQQDLLEPLANMFDDELHRGLALRYVRYLLLKYGTNRKISDCAVSEPENKMVF